MFKINAEMMNQPEKIDLFFDIKYLKVIKITGGVSPQNDGWWDKMNSGFRRSFYIRIVRNGVRADFHAYQCN